MRLSGFSGAIALTLWGGGALATPVPACEISGDFAPVDTDTGLSTCAISWVKDGRLVRIVWERSSGTDEVRLDDVPGFDQVLTAERPPELIDIDQDGWPDLGVFTLLGMVNGDYEVFRYDPATARFAPFGLMNGSYFLSDRDHVIAIGRSSAAASGVDAYRATAEGLVAAFGLYVDAGQPIDANDRASCEVAVDGVSFDNPELADLANIYPDAPDLIADYCNLYDGGSGSGIRLADVGTDAKIVPEGTVFHCVLDGGTHAVTITQEDGNFIYSYGPLGGDPELQMERLAEEMSILPENGAGPSRFGEITFENGAYAYTAYYSYELADAIEAGDPFRAKTFQRGLVVVKDGNMADPLFEKSCILATSFDKIGEL